MTRKSDKSKNFVFVSFRDKKKLREKRYQSQKFDAHRKKTGLKCESKNSFLVWAEAMESWRFLRSSLELIESSIGECISGKLASLRFIIRERLPSHPRETFSTVKHEKNNAKWKGFGSAISSNRIALQIYSDRAQPKPIL